MCPTEKGDNVKWAIYGQRPGKWAESKFDELVWGYKEWYVSTKKWIKRD